MEKNDAMLVAECLKGDQVAFDQLMLRYQRLVYRTAYGFCNEPQQAMDLTQSAFLKVYERLPSLADPARFKAWLVRIVYNVCHDWLRSQSKAEQVEASELDETAALGEFESQEMQLLVSENRRQLQKLMADLNPRYRLAVVLKYFEGASLREIADVFQTSENVVKNMLYRSLRQMAAGAGN